jgi:hypothetical protein
MHMRRAIKFRMTRGRAGLFGLTEVEGYAGFWPLREAVHYRVGMNCDEIRIAGDKLLVMNASTPVAIAEYKPMLLDDARAQGLTWERLVRSGRLI